MEVNTRLFIEGAKALKLPVVFHPEINALEIVLGKHHYYFSRSKTHLNTGAHVFAAKNKAIAHRLLKLHHLPVPNSVAFSRQIWLENKWQPLIHELSFPLVIKPVQNTTRGFRVLCNIRNIDDLSMYLKKFFEDFSEVQVEEFYQHGNEYRVTLYKDKVLGVVQRFGASVIGDGLHTIEELIQIKNKERLLLKDKLTISPLIYDIEYENCLKEQGLCLSDIPAIDRFVKLCYTVNTGRGGDVISRGRSIHPDNVKMLSQALDALGLEYAGIDVICSDINQPFQTGGWMIIELNYNPDTTIHEAPPVGERSPLIKKILRKLIYRHPWAYFKILMKQRRFALFFKFIVILALLLVVLAFLSLAKT